MLLLRVMQARRPCVLRCSWSWVFEDYSLEQNEDTAARYFSKTVIVKTKDALPTVYCDME